MELPIGQISFHHAIILGMGMFRETLNEVAKELQEELSMHERAQAVMTYLAIALDKAIVYNTVECRFDHRSRHPQYF